LTNVVVSYCCDRAFSVTWGIEGGLPSIPHGVWLNPGTQQQRFLGVVFAGEPLKPGDHFTRPSAGGGGLGDPLERDPGEVVEDVIDGYVSVACAATDYGVVIDEIDPEVCAYEIDQPATDLLRTEIRGIRKARLEEDPQEVHQRLIRGELDWIDVIRHYGVIVDMRREGSPVLLRSTEQFRETMRRRSAAYW
jgi:N-methylhydantoinase B